MAIYRVHKNKNYTTIDNNIFKNKDMSYKTTGLLCTMLSLPDDWNFNISGLVSLKSDKDTVVRTALQELEELGYLTRTKVRSNSGTFIDWQYDIYELPLVEKPQVENPQVEKPHVENQTLLNTKELNTKELNTTIYDFLEENGFQLAPLHYEIIKTWDDNELTRHAIKQAVLNNKYNIKYIDRILYSYQKDNIKTLEQALEREKKFSNKKTQDTELPTWFDKENEVEISKEEEQEMEDILKDLGV